MEKKQKRIRFIAVVLTMLMLLGLSATNALASDLPSTNERGSITVHKYSTAAESQTPGTGLAMKPDEAAKLGTPMPNVGFTLHAVRSEYEVTYTTTVADAKANSDELSEKLTAQDGSAVWTDLPIGYYVLSETTPPSGTDYQTSPDVIITMPMGITAEGKGWNYDIHVYPKNVKTAALSKEVLGISEYYNSGDIVSWKIDSKIAGPLSDGTNHGSFKVSDPLDARLTYVEDSDSVIATGGTTSPITLQREVDYTVQVDGGNIVVWELTNNGISKIFTAGAQALSIQFKTTVNSKAIVSVQSASDLDLTNGARIDWKDLSEGDNEFVIDEKDKPTITFGGVIINKIDSIDKNLLLDGAVFKIATTRENAQNGDYIVDAISGDDIEITTGDIPDTAGEERGWAMVAALPVDTKDDTKYYLVETKAPEGYVLRQSIIEVTIPASEKIETVKIENQKIGNPPIPGDKPTFVLPPTGGIGTTMFITVGVTMMVIASYMMIMVASKKRKSERSDNIAG